MCPPPYAAPRPLLWACTGSPVTTSTSRCRRRLPVCLLTCRNEMRSLAATAGYKATGQETRESFKKPFQSARGTTSILHTHRFAGTTPQMVVRTRVFESDGPTGHEKSAPRSVAVLIDWPKERIVALPVVPQCNSSDARAVVHRPEASY